MNKLRYDDAKRMITMTKIGAWAVLLTGVVQLLFIHVESTPSSPLWERIFMMLNLFLIPILYLRTLKKLSIELRFTSYEVFECRYSMKIVCPFFIWFPVMFAIMQLNDTDIIKSRAYSLWVITTGFGVGWYYLSKYWLKKELAKRKER